MVLRVHDGVVVRHEQMYLRSMKLSMHLIRCFGIVVSPSLNVIYEV